MDGTNAAFLFDSPLFSEPAGPLACGILYVEDFDDTPREPRAEIVCEPPAPSFSADELLQAREAGRQEGLAAALADAQLLQAQLQLAATQSLVDGLAATRSTFAEIVGGSAERVSQTILAVLQAALPTVMRRHDTIELQAMIAALAPGLACEPQLRVRAHPDLAEFVRESLMSALQTTDCVLSVCADPSLQAGDVLITWQDGQARRDCASAWKTIAGVLAPLGLPSFEEVCDARRC